MRGKKPINIELITWALIIIATAVTVFVFPWYTAEVILKYLLGAFAVASMVWYVRSRKLFIESEEKTKMLIKQQKELRNHQKTIDLIFENSADGILVLDEHQRIVSFSPGLEKTTGFKREEVIGRPAQQMLKFRSPSGGSVLPDLMFLPKEIKQNTLIQNFITTKNGRELEIEASSTLVRDPSGEYKAMAIIRDVTYERELVQRDKEFVAITSHQLNTPLSIIRGYISLLKNGKIGSLTQEQNGYIGEIYTAVNKMIDLVNNILSISRIEAEKIKLTKEDVNLSDLFKELEQKLDRSKLRKEVKLVFGEVNKNAIVYADHDKLFQVLSNLADDCMKYTLAGEIRFSTQESGGDSIIVISDTGIGIPKDDMDKVGQKFYRSQNAIDLDNKGTGLGMFISKTIIEKHGGTFKIDSALGKGTTFEIILPGKSNLEVSNG